MSGYASIRSSFLDRLNGFRIPSSNSVYTVGTSTSVITREVVRLILELEGMGVTEASDGFEALERLHRLREADPQRPCAVVLDIMMPRCSGADGGSCHGSARPPLWRS